MPTTAQWVQGARPRTLPNAIGPVVAGTGAAASVDDVTWGRAVLALVVAVALIVGVNYANDYSDGIRGTDADRVGPLRLVGSGTARPEAVRLASVLCFGLAAVVGLVLVAVAGHWWLIALGAVCIAGAWFYTGGTRPYGYAGLGEVAVFLFFGPAAVLGTQYVVADEVNWSGAVIAVATGCCSAAVLVANNLRDIPTDSQVGKNTLPVRLGDRRTRILYLTLLAVPFAVSIALVGDEPAALAGLVAVVPAVPGARAVRSGATGRDLVPVLGATGITLLVWSVATAVALVLSS